MDLESIAQHLSAADVGVRIEGFDRNIFIHQMPSIVKRGVLIRGPQSAVMIDHELPGYFKTSFQVIVRSDDHRRGQELAEAVSNALTIRLEQMIGQMKVRQIYPKHLPLVYPTSEGDRLEWSINFFAAFSNA